MRTLRVGIDGGLACSPRPTGVEHFARSLLGELVRVHAPEVAWFVYLPPFGDPGLESSASVTLRHRPDVNTLIKTPWLVAQTWRDRVEVVLAFGHLLPKGVFGRQVRTIHDTAFDEFPDCYPPGSPETAHAQVKEACARSARLLVPSEATRTCVARDYGYPAARIDVLGEGAREAFRPDGPQALPEAMRQRGVLPPFFLTVGRLDRRKNLERVVAAYRRLLRDGAACGGLVVVGPDDSGADAIRARVAADPVPGERIVFTGYLEEGDLAALYRLAAAVVYPSLAEGFGLPVLEGMASGTPVITSNRSSLAEVAGDGALLVDPLSTEDLAAAMRQVLTDPILRSQLQSRGLRRAREFSWQAAAERTVAALRRAAAA